MDFLLAVGWLVASVGFGYLVTKAVKGHIRSHRETELDIADIRIQIARLSSLSEYEGPDELTDVELVELGYDPTRGGRVGTEEEDVMPF